MLGPLLGAVALQFLSEWLRQNFTDCTRSSSARSSSSPSSCCRGLVNFAREACEAAAYRPARTSGGTGCEPPSSRRSGLGRSFGGLTAVADVSLSASSEGTVLGVIGPNGAGKSTLINLVTGHVKPTDGPAC